MLRMIRDRELGYFGNKDDKHRIIYKNFDKFYPDTTLQRHLDQNGIVTDLEYNPDGNLLVAANATNSALIFDTHNEKLIGKIENAHDWTRDWSLSCVKFLCPNTFATCAQGTSIKLWDTRCLRTSTRTLETPIQALAMEYSHLEKTMVTLDNECQVYAIDLGNPSEENVFYKVFNGGNVQKLKFTPDGKKLVVGTSNGYIMVVADLDLKYFWSDMNEKFQPHLYTWMEEYSYLFSRTRIRNRIEFIDAFALDYYNVNSLQIHPTGSCALSRTSTFSDNVEWIYIHDITTKVPTNCEESIVNENYAIDASRGDPKPIKNFYRRTHYKKEFFSFSTQDAFFMNFKIPGEMSFSNDGKVICVPYNEGIRLLSFNENVQDIFHCPPLSEDPRELYTLKSIKIQGFQHVVCCKFNPKHYQLVTMNSNDELVWCKPVL